jgi:hypothetical protein
MRRLTVPVLLAVGGLAWAGVHLLAHRLAAGESAHAGHGHAAETAAYMSTSLSLCLSLAIVLAGATGLYPAWRGASVRSVWLFGAVPLLGLFGGAALDSGGSLAALGANAAGLLPVALLVLAVQLAVALTVVRIARGLLDLVEGTAWAVAGTHAVPAPARSASFPRLDSVRAPAGRLAPSGGPRAPPAS